MQKRRRVILSLIGVGVLVGVIAVVFRPAPEPEYGGKKLSDWAKMYVEGLKLSSGSEEADRAANAICAIGTNAIPYLSNWMAFRPPRWQHAIARLHVGPVRVNPRSLFPSNDEKFSRVIDSKYAWIALDNRFGPTHRELNQWLPWDGAAVNLFTLETWATTATNSDTSPIVALWNCYMLGRSETNSSDFAPEIERLLSHEELEVRRAATNALRRLRGATNSVNVQK